MYGTAEWATRERKVRGVETGTGLAFGDLLRRHRASANMTQEDLARSTGLTPQAIGLLERGERRRPHGYTVQVLGEALGLEGRGFAEFEAAARRPPARGAPVEPYRHALPAPPTSLIGREQEVATLTDLLLREEVRLLTLTGPGGVGKTRLALEVAERSSEEFADGVAFVPLAPLPDCDPLRSVIAQTLGIKDAGNRTLEEAVKQHLEGKQMLLLLDNFEHLLEAGPVVGDLVRSSPGLTVLVTSRAPLRLSGERQFPLSPLSLTEESSLEHSPAVQLFVERARDVSPGFEVGAEAAVAEICKRLDGLPLAIELAAARVKVFSPRALLERLDPRLPLLSGGARDLPERHQALRATVAWSYDLLEPDEQDLFVRLAVFAGGFSLDAVETVCGRGIPDGGSALETLASLVDNSLVVSRVEASSDPGGDEPRFTMLETIREYAAEHLDKSGEAEEVHRAHAMYYSELAEAVQPETSAGSLTEWLVILDREHDNMRAALHWAIRHGDVDFGTRLALMLWRFWPERHHVTEGRRWLETVLALGQPESGVSEPTLSARRWAFLHLVTGMLAGGQGDYDRAVELYEESLTLYRNMGHEKGASGPLRELGVAAYHRGDYERAVLLSEQALAISRESGSAFGSGLAVCTLADALRARGDIERARTLLEQSLASLRRQTYPLRVANALAVTLSRLGSIECELGRNLRALELHKESLALARQYGFTFEVFVSLEGLARVEALLGRPQRAARLLGASAAQREDIGSPLTPVTRADHDHAENSARAALGEGAFEVAWAAGHAISLEEAILEVVGEDG